MYNLGHYVLRLETMLWFLLILIILFSSDGFLAPNDFSDYLTLQSFNYQGTDKNYSRNVSSTLNSIVTYFCLYLYIIFKWFIGFIKELQNIFQIIEIRSNKKKHLPKKLLPPPRGEQGTTYLMSG